MPIDTRTDYPAPFDRVVLGRERKRLGNAVGLDQFGVNLTTLKPGAASALRHWHEKEDELVYMLEGEVVLIEDGGETVLKPGDAAGFKANDAQRSSSRQQIATATRSISKSARARSTSAPNIPMSICVVMRDDNGMRYTHKNGEPYAAGERRARSYDLHQFHPRHRRRRHRARHLEHRRGAR